MGIVDEDIARVRESSDAVAIIGEQVALRRVGTRLMGLCPFHNEKTSSFSVNAAEGLYYCYGCGAKGDLITFVRETHHLDFVGAVEFLAQRAGITLRYDTPGATKEHHRKGELTEAMEAAVEWYHQRLMTAPDAGPARAYLRGARGYGVDTVKAFRLGWAPEGWDELSTALKRFPPDVLRDAGLAFRNKVGRQTDAFRARVMFPIFDAGGKPVAMGGRILPGADGPKYKNSQEGPLYSKRKVLYGLNWAKGDVVRAGEVIVCEGYTDVIAFHQAAVPRAVATCGTALADEHMQLLKGFARRIVLAYDADNAGQGAAEKFYAWEQKLDLDIRVLALPPGTDPGELGSRDPAALRAATEAARPFLAFRIERILSAADPSTPEGRARGAERALAAVAEHPDPLVRDQYLMQISDWARIGPDLLRSQAIKPSKPREDRPPPRPARRAVAPGYPVELEALRLAIHQPERVATVLEEVLFTDPVAVAAFRALLEAPTLPQAIEGAPDDAADLLHRLAVEEPTEDPDEVVASLVRLAVPRAVAAIEAEIRITQQPVSLVWIKEREDALRDPERRIEATAELVAWLVERARRLHDRGGTDALER